MHGDLLDVLLLVAGVLFAVSGYRQGFVVGALSFAGFLGGGVLGARLAPRLARTQLLDGLSETVVGLGAVFVLACLGQVLATLVGSRLRAGLTWRPARLVDAVAGAVISVVSVLRTRSGEYSVICATTFGITPPMPRPARNCGMRLDWDDVRSSGSSNRSESRRAVSPGW